VSKALALLAIVALTFALNGSALTMGFGRDDGNNLFNAVRLSPIVYFLDPATLSAVSANALTPWNLLVYDIGVTLFGLDARLHHLHLLLVVAACGYATFGFLRFWLADTVALMGALLFLAGTPVVFISHEEMSGHYLYGLLFTILAASCFVLGMRSGRPLPKLAGALLYAMACACKEVFVPLPVLLLFLPEKTLGERVRGSWGMWLVVALYTAWRWVVFEGSLLGPRGVPIQPTEALAQVAHIPLLLFGLAWYAVLVVVALALWRRRLSGREALFGVVLLGALVAPLLPVTGGVGIHAPDRLLLLIWWAFACLVAVLSVHCFRQRKLALLFLALLAASQVLVSLPWRAEIAAIKGKWAQWYGVVLQDHGPAHLVLLKDKEYFWQKFHVEGMRMAARQLGLPFNPRARVISDAADMLESGPQEPANYLSLDEKTGTLRPARDEAELVRWASALPPKKADVYVFRAMPRMRFAQGGKVDAPGPAGALVTVTGELPGSSLGQGLLALVPQPCVSRSLARTAGAQDGMVHFELVLACAGPEAAKDVAAHVCVAASNGGDVIVPAGQANKDCDRLWQR
jgi:hypothetical protein